MCIGKPCQNCETCGQRKWQFWADREMHPRGCPWGFDRMDQCPDAINRARLLRWSIDNGVQLREQGHAYVTQMEAAGVDTLAPPIKWTPEDTPAHLHLREGEG